METWWVNFLRHEYERGDMHFTKFKGKITSNVTFTWQPKAVQRCSFKL